MRQPTSKKANVTLWVVQGVLAALFLFAGSMKLVMPLEQMQQGPIALPGGLLRFIGVVEVLGALGLILPGIFRIHRYLTPLAAAGLTIVMTGAVVISVVGMGAGAAIVPLIVGALTVTVARGRRESYATA